MSGFDAAKDGPIEDRPADAEIGAPRLLSDGFRPYERFEVKEGGAELTRDILRVGEVAAVLPYDPARGRFVLIRQFRLSAQLATGKGDIVELVAGGVEAGEEPEQAARRECAEEIGVTPASLRHIVTLMPTPGVTDEHAAFFLAIVDSTRVPATAGAASEAEATRPFTIAVDDALAAMRAGAVGNAFLLCALQWFALNRAAIEDEHA